MSEQEKKEKQAARLYDAVTGIDERLIEEAQQLQPSKKKKKVLTAWLAAAACLVLVAGGIFAVFRAGLFGGKRAAEAETTTEPAETEAPAELSDTQCIAGRTYLYEKPGFGVPSMNDFTITINEDGTFSYYEGPLSSHIGAGSWTAEENILTLTEEYGERTNRFELAPGALIWRAEGSDNFIYVKVQDGERFTEQELPENVIEEPSAVPVETSMPAPEETEPLPSETAETPDRAEGSIMFGGELYTYSIKETAACELTDDMMAEAVPVPAGKTPAEDGECSTDARRVRVLLKDDDDGSGTLLVEEDGEQYLAYGVSFPETELLEWTDTAADGIDPEDAARFGTKARDYVDAYLQKTELYRAASLTRGTALNLEKENFDAESAPVVDFREYTYDFVSGRLTALQNLADRERTYRAMQGIARYDYRAESELTDCLVSGNYAKATVTVFRSFAYSKGGEGSAAQDVFTVILLRRGGEWYVADMYSRDEGGIPSPAAKTGAMTAGEVAALQEYCNGGAVLDWNVYREIRCFRSCCFTEFDTESISAEDFLRYCTPKDTVSGDEREAVLAAWGAGAPENRIIQKFPETYIAEILELHLPYMPAVPESWKQPQTGAEYVYLEEYGAFYNAAPMEPAPEFSFSGGIWDDGYAVLFEADTGATLTLWLSSGRVWMCARVPAGT